ncbi:MAG: DUF5320 domain-containing protein [Bacillota bacterium]
MPRRDGTGPEGLGAETGRGLGPCGSNSDEIVNNSRALGRRQGRGLRQRRNMKPGRGRNRK